jgi:hypothetical protein
MLRFYILNASWNYKFWIFSKKIYKVVNYDIEDGEYGMGDDFKIKKNKKKISKKRFVGYFYKNNIYLDNPGLKIDDRETWESWKRRGMIK